jgi:hypothetical protein
MCLGTTTLVLINQIYTKPRLIDQKRKGNGILNSASLSCFNKAKEKKSSKHGIPHPNHPILRLRDIL